MEYTRGGLWDIFATVCLLHPLQEMHIQLSSATYEHLKGSHFIFERRGIITIKVKGLTQQQLQQQRSPTSEIVSFQ